MNLTDVIKKYDIYDENGNLLNKTDTDFFEKDKTNCRLTFELRKIRMTFAITIKKFLDKDKNINYFIISKDISSDIKLQKLQDGARTYIYQDVDIKNYVGKNITLSAFVRGWDYYDSDEKILLLQQ